MVAIKLRNFGGMIPAIDDTLLPDTAASQSTNTWVWPGALEGLRKTEFLRSVTTGTRLVYRIPQDEDQPYNYDYSFYMEFADPETTVIRSPIFDDTYARYYWASPTQRPRYNTRARILSEDDEYYLGIPAPVDAPSCVVTGGAGSNVDRVYVYTWVSTFGEEGAPSPPLLKTGKEDGSWDLTLTAPGTPETDNRSLATVRIYRTVTSVTGTPVFYLVTEQDISDTTYSDTQSNADIALNSILQSTFYYEPPTDLKGFVLGPEGMLVGWRENEVWFSEPYRPHAWPTSYVLTVDGPVVNISVIGNTFIVLTKGSPSMISGNHPSSMAQAKFQVFEPCLSKNSVVAMEQGIAYVSYNGLILISPSGVTNVTQKLIDRHQWLRDYNARYIKGARINSVYFGFGSVESGAFEPTAFETTAFEQNDFTGARTGFYLDPTNDRVGFNAVADDPVLQVFEDGWTGDTLMIRSDDTLSIVSPASELEQRAYLWRSKIFDMLEPLNLGAAKVMFVPNPFIELDETEVVSLTQEFNELSQYGLFRVYADGVLVYCKELRTSGQVFRLPSGFKAQYWQFEVEATVTIRSIEIATTVKELQGV